MLQITIDRSSEPRERGLPGQPGLELTLIGTTAPYLQQGAGEGTLGFDADLPLR
jgi:hypothetical protein